MEERTLKKKLGENITRLRFEAGFKSQEAFGKAIGVNKTSVWNYENGVNFFTVDRLPTILRVLKCSVKELFWPLYDEFTEDPEYTEICFKIKSLFRYQTERNTIQTLIDSLYLLLLGIRFLY